MFVKSSSESIGPPAKCKNSPVAEYSLGMVVLLNSSLA